MGVVYIKTAISEYVGGNDHYKIFI